MSGKYPQTIPHRFGAISKCFGGQKLKSLMPPHNHPLDKQGIVFQSALYTNVMEICNDLSSKIKSSFIMTLFKQFADKNDVVIC